MSRFYEDPPAPDKTIVQRIVNAFIIIALAIIIAIIAYSLGYQTGANDTCESFDYIASDTNSIANRIVASNGTMLPVDKSAIGPGSNFYYFGDKAYNYDAYSIREYYESFGIIIGEKADITGWYHCTLPEGWTVYHDDTPDRSRDETTYFLAADGTSPFQIISEKDQSILSVTISADYCGEEIS